MIIRNFTQCSLTNISSLNGANVVDSLTIYNNKSLNNCCAISHNLFDEDNKPSYILIDSNENNCDEIDSVKSFCLENEFPCGVYGYTDTFMFNIDFDSLDCTTFEGSIL